METPSPVPGAEVWLVVHEDVRHMPRIRAVLDCITETFHRTANAMNPDAEAHGDPQE